MQVETLGAECGRPISSVAWSTRGTYLAAGCDSGAVQIFDAATVSPYPYIYVMHCGLVCLSVRHVALRSKNTSCLFSPSLLSGDRPHSSTIAGVPNLC